MTEDERKSIKEENLDKARRQNNKQHCQKIIEGIGRFDDTTASRAVWELLQNARDQSEHARVKFVLDSDKLVFSHEGKPFNYDSFTSLIKQVSSEEKEDPNAAGQFGTGFMTTHKFSRKIQIDGCMQLTEQEYAPIKGFMLDRTATEIPDMIDAMSAQLKYADELIDHPTILEPLQETTFTYFLDEDHYPAAEQGINNAIELLPYVMTINDRIEQVEISGSRVDRPVKIVKEKVDLIDSEAKLYEVTIRVNDTDRKKYYYLQSDDRKDMIILPLESATKACSLGNVPRFFIFFPLLGTESFGLNYIFHSERFYPEEPRNAIVLPEGNVDKKEKFESNVAVLADMTEMLFCYLRKYASLTDTAQHLAEVSMDTHENSHQLTRDFYTQLRKQYINEFLNEPFIKIGTERLSVAQHSKVRFLAPDIVDFLQTAEGASYYDVVYDYAQKVSLLPERNECLEWSSIVSQWTLDSNEYFVGVADIVGKIKEVGEKRTLLSFLMFLKESQQLEKFPSVALFPNREGELKTRQLLYDASDITDILYDVSKPLIPSDTNRFVDNEFLDICDFPKYGRDDLKKSINDYVNSQKDQQEPFKETLTALLDYCSVFPVQNGNSIRNNAMPYVCELFDHTYKPLYQAPLPDVEADKEQNLYRTAFEVLVEYVLKHIESIAIDKQDWFEEHKQLHFNLLNALSSRERTTTFQTEMFAKYAIMPSQDGILHKVNELSILANATSLPEGVKEKLCDIYYKVHRSSLTDKLVDDNYSWMSAFEVLLPSVVCRDIDEKLKEDEYKKNVFIEIVDLLDNDPDDGYWRTWFKSIDEKKANIFLSRLKGNERASTYKFIKADPQRKEKLLALIDRPDFDTIIKKAEDYIENEHEKHIVFTHMYSIGKEIEDKLRKALDETLLEVQFARNDEEMKVKDKQDGQDIVVRYKGHEIYFVEVKSKWNFKEPAHMSVKQMRQAVLTPNKYALCCVELTDYSSDEVERIPVETILSHLYVHLDIGYKLSYLLKTIVEDDSDAETHIKIYDYQSALNKGFFVSSPNKGLQPLVDAVVAKAEEIKSE